MIDGGQELGSGGGGVTSLNLLAGALSLIGGTNVTITPSGDTIRIDATAGGAGIASINTSTIGAQTLVSSNTDILTISTNVGTGVTAFSLIVGTAANELLQLNASAQLPAVDIGTLGVVANPSTMAPSSLNAALSDIFIYTGSGVTQKGINYLILSTDNIIEVEGDSLTMSLPDATAVPVGKIYYVNNSDVTGTSVVPSVGGQFINNTLTTWSISNPFTGSGFYSNGTGWRTI